MKIYIIKIKLKKIIRYNDALNDYRDYSLILEFIYYLRYNYVYFLN